MKRRIIKETVIYLLLLLGLALLMHPDLLSNPSERLTLIREQDSYAHPLIYSGLVYVFILIIRLVIGFISRQIKRISLH